MTTNLMSNHLSLSPSRWVTRFGVEIAAGGSVLDLACGGGRHANWFAARGHPVVAVDREQSDTLAADVDFILADLESGSWPLTGRNFAAIIVTNYLFRPLFPQLLRALEPHGWLIYETFAVGNEKYGRPSNPDFLLQPGELLEVVRGRLQVVAFEHGYQDSPRPAMVQRIAAYAIPQ